MPFHPLRLAAAATAALAVLTSPTMSQTMKADAPAPASVTTGSTPPDTAFGWLEEVQGERALAWVKKSCKEGKDYNSPATTRSR